MNRIIIRFLLVAIFLLPIALVGFAQHGGKAEGRRVTFKPGSTSAVFTGSVRDGLEIEYEFEAQDSQELVVRIVSSPPGSAYIKVMAPGARALAVNCLEARLADARVLGLPTSSHCYNDNPQLLRREGRTWSATLPESGNYTLSVIRPEGKGVSTYSLMIIIPPTEGGQQPLSATDSTLLDEAMRQFIASFKTKNRTAFLSHFSRTRFFYASNPLNQMRVTVPYTELAQDFRKKGSWYCSYLERCDELDAFVDNIGDGEMWTRVGHTTFVPRGDDSSSLTFVKWRKDGSRWVISEISYPQA